MRDVARKNKLTIDFDGFDILQKRVTELGGDAKQAAENALVESHKIVTQKVTAAMVKHRESGDTADAIISAPVVKWTGDTAAVDVGFDIMGGGLPSIFLMYGTPRHAVKNQYGTPKKPGAKTEANGVTQDKKLFDAIFGSKVNNKIADRQAAIFAAAIEKKKGGG